MKKIVFVGNEACQLAGSDSEAENSTLTAAWFTCYCSQFIKRLSPQVY